MRDTPKGFCVRALVGAIAAVTIFCLSAASANAYVVRSIDSEVVVLSDGSLEVTDVVTVAMTSPWRDSRYLHPTVRMPGGWGDIDVIAVTRDGIAEAWRLEGNSILSSADDEDLLETTYVYRFHYRVPNQVQFLTDRDRIFWFATGSAAIGSIADVNIRIVLPPDIDIVDIQLANADIAVIGPNQRPDEDGGQVFSFAVRGTIEADVTLPIYVDVTPGTFAPPNEWQRVTWTLLRSNMLVGIAAILAVLAFYGFYFIRGFPRRSAAAAGRTVTPAALRFLLRKRFDATALLAAILSLVSKGHVKLRGTEAGSHIEPALGRRQAQPLADEEAKVYDRLFRKGEVGLPLSGNADQRLVDAAIVLKSELEARWVRRSPLDRRTCLAIGHGIAIFGVLLVGLTSAGPSYGLLIGGGVALWTTALALFVWFTVAIFRALRRGERGLGRIVAFFVPPVTLWVAYQADRLAGESWALLGLGGVVPILLSFGFAIVSFAILRPRIDRDAATQQEIDDIRRRIETRDAVRPLTRDIDPGMPLKIDPLLPYAVALGARHSGFEAVFDAMRGVAGISPELVHWQSGDSIDGQIPGFGVAFYVDPPPPPR